MSLMLWASMMFCICVTVGSVRHVAESAKTKLGMCAWIASLVFPLYLFAVLLTSGKYLLTGT